VELVAACDGWEGTMTYGGCSYKRPQGENNFRLGNNENEISNYTCLPNSLLLVSIFLSIVVCFDGIQH
jgi:hypothetical protein